MNLDAGLRSLGNEPDGRKSMSHDRHDFAKGSTLLAADSNPMTTRSFPQGGPRASPRDASAHSDPQARLRREYVAAIRDFEQRLERTLAAGGSYFDVHLDLSPFLDLRCGARGKRTGRPCPQSGLFRSGRCRWHGGLSTGPKTQEGKARAAANVQIRWSVLRQATKNAASSRQGPPQRLDQLDADAHWRPSGEPEAYLKQVHDERDSDMQSPTTTPNLESPPSHPHVQRAGQQSTLASIRAALEAAGPRGVTITALQRLTGHHQSVVEAGVRLLCAMGLAEKTRSELGSVRYVRKLH